MNEWGQEFIDSRIDRLTDHVSGMTCFKCKIKAPKAEWIPEKGVVEARCKGCGMLYADLNVGRDSRLDPNPFSDERAI